MAWLPTFDARNNYAFVGRFGKQIRKDEKSKKAWRSPAQRGHPYIYDVAKWYGIFALFDKADCEVTKLATFLHVPSLEKLIGTPLQEGLDSSHQSPIASLLGCLLVAAVQLDCGGCVLTTNRINHTHRTNVGRATNQHALVNSKHDCEVFNSPQNSLGFLTLCYHKLRPRS
jgi:hypothetical protein